MKSGLEIVPVKWIDQVLELALESKPVALVDEEVAAPLPVSSAAGAATGSVKH